MSNLDLLKEKASCFKCSNCKTTGNRLIAPSTTISGQYYITCMTCGNVTIAKENLSKDGQVAFTVNETSKTKKTAATEILINDAMKAYEALGYETEHMCVSPREAEKYLLKKELKAELLNEMMEMSESVSEVAEIEESKTYLVVCENCLDAMYDAKSLVELQDMIERDFKSLDDLRIFEIAREVNVEKKLVLS